MRPYLSTLRYVKCHYDTAAETANEFYRASEEAIVPPASEFLEHQVLLRCHLLPIPKKLTAHVTYL